MEIGHIRLSISWKPSARRPLTRRNRLIFAGARNSMSLLRRGDLRATLFLYQPAPEPRVGMNLLRGCAGWCERPAFIRPLEDRAFEIADVGVATCAQRARKLC